MFSTRLKRTASLHFISKRGGASFQEVLRTRRHEANCTVLIENSKAAAGDHHHHHHHHKELVDFCSKFGKLSKVYSFVYQNRGPERQMYLVRFTSPGAATALLEACPHQSPTRGSIPTNTRHLVYSPHSSPSTTNNLPVEFERQDMTMEAQLQEATSISEQIQLIYEAERQSEFDLSMRFFICRQIEGILKGLWTRLAVLPFGSSINSLGRRPSDLDMAISLNYDMPGKSSKSCLQHADLGQQMIEWSHAKETVPKLAEIFKLVPAFERPIYIIARVPILTFRHRSLPVDCDLSFSNLSGLYMSEMLYKLADLDPRVRPLVFAVRSWAKVNQLNKPRPSHTPSSFMLTLLTVFFLQQEAVVPPLEHLFNDQSHQDIAYLDLNPHLNILKKNISWKSANTDNLETLLGKFLEYYASFPFDDKGICVVKGHLVPKTERCAMYMVNPLNPSLNASKNVGYMELGKLVRFLQLHAQLFPHLQNGPQQQPWGFMELLPGKDAATEPPVSHGTTFQVRTLY